MSGSTPLRGWSTRPWPPTTSLPWKRRSPRRPGWCGWRRPSNPLLRVIDIAAVAELAHRHGAIAGGGQHLCHPLPAATPRLGADAVVHSTTKYLGGHSDVVGGFIATSDDDLASRLAFVQNSAGAVPGPFDCFLVLRGIKTLAVRMERHCANAEAVVELLASHPAVDRVYYPGLAAHPGHDIAARQMRRFGGMVSFTLRQGEDAALAVAGATRLFTLAESLGAVESLIEHPHRMTHASVVGSPARRRPGAGPAFRRHRDGRRPARRP